MTHTSVYILHSIVRGLLFKVVTRRMQQLTAKER